MRKTDVRNSLCLALDVDSLSEAMEMVKLLKDYVGLFKIGSQLFTKEGPKAVEAINNIGGRVFLDLKFHDIPNTVAQAARMATRIGAYVFNVHACGGSAMMRAAVDAAEEEADKGSLPSPVILAVTVLTSINDEVLRSELNVSSDVRGHVIDLARLAQRAGVSGVVASPREILLLREACGGDFVILTPGIRPSWSTGKDDQKRITTPGEAMRLGADYIVVGRPILKANNPVDAVEQILADMVSLNV
ncbi:MAG: orotidine-5'-phosphate decarboxylase [Candidatus Magnetobacterium sp. LHC-1]|uniref:Orotidine 5'-phosphate decarboxylase n=1 Tax=Candidatus Magnetobacterium casense TaxID=1455061 RepID=A0ABS6RUE5_9BACT|nr:orotidine-5'-phosphate decarboxylase [Candidatus Magnetobacterium casensis]MBF0606173.1 orotidine-5'-phosphate decarboxylase [Nitrospirota bacterium]MBV6340211.1 orotidine-5'-phosphate decarboxylase [Candidatus Magnetobacterium casensis]